jgi:basic membrane protein A
MIKKIKLLLLSAVVSAGAWGCAKNDKIGTNKESYKISLILSTGGVNDQSFNQSAWEGALKAQEELGVEVSYLESNSDSDYMQNIETAVEDSDLIVGVGFQVGDSIKEAEKVYTDKQFVTIDSENENVDNVRAITFSEEEA